MNKVEFVYQRFNLRIGLSVLILPIVYIMRNILFKQLGIKDEIYIFFGAIITVIGLMIYYKWTENSPLFLSTGYYWTEKDTVFIQRGTKIREIKNVDWINGAITSAYGVRAAMLVVQCGKKKTLLFSKPIEDNIDFSSTELYPIYRLILENNPKLQKDMNLPYWYERKKEC